MTSDSMNMSLSKLQETVKDREALHATIHGFAKSWTGLSDCTSTTTGVILDIPQKKKKRLNLHQSGTRGDRGILIFGQRTL